MSLLPRAISRSRGSAYRTESGIFFHPGGPLDVVGDVQGAHAIRTAEEADQSGLRRRRKTLSLLRWLSALTCWLLCSAKSARHDRRLLEVEHRLEVQEAQQRQEEDG